MARAHINIGVNLAGTLRVSHDEYRSHDSDILAHLNFFFNEHVLIARL